MGEPGAALVPDPVGPVGQRHHRAHPAAQPPPVRLPRGPRPEGVGVLVADGVAGGPQRQLLSPALRVDARPRPQRGHPRHLRLVPGVALVDQHPVHLHHQAGRGRLAPRHRPRLPLVRLRQLAQPLRQPAHRLPVQGHPQALRDQPHRRVERRLQPCPPRHPRQPGRDRPRPQPQRRGTRRVPHPARPAVVRPRQPVLAHQPHQPPLAHRHRPQRRPAARAARPLFRHTRAHRQQPPHPPQQPLHPELQRPEVAAQQPRRLPLDQRPHQLPHLRRRPRHRRGTFHLAPSSPHATSQQSGVPTRRVPPPPPPRG